MRTAVQEYTAAHALAVELREGRAEPKSGTQFTCFTCTNVLAVLVLTKACMLTPKALLAQASPCPFGRMWRSLLDLLVQRLSI